MRFEMIRSVNRLLAQHERAVGSLRQEEVVSCLRHLKFLDAESVVEYWLEDYNDRLEDFHCPWPVPVMLRVETGNPDSRLVAMSDIFAGGPVVYAGEPLSISLLQERTKIFVESIGSRWQEQILQVSDDARQTSLLA
jgi:hypothetical protein